jgi:hypothetical protein
MSLAIGDLLQEIYNSYSTTDNPSTLSMTGVVLTFFLCWFIGVLCFTGSVLSSNTDNNNNSSNKKFGSVEAFRNIFQRQRVVTKPTTETTTATTQTTAAVRSPFQTFIESTTKSLTGSTSSTNLFLSSSAESLEVAYRDLAPPFNIMTDENTDNNNNAPLEDFSHIVEGANITHFCFLLHGHRGLSRDLAYFQTVMQRWASEELKKQQQQQQQQQSDEVVSSTTDIIKNVTNTTTAMKLKQDMVVHSSVCNEGKTQDGVQNGGDRLVEEMRQVIDMEMTKRHPSIHKINTPDGEQKENEETAINTPDSSSSSNDVQKENNPEAVKEHDEETKIYDITISILGNSLGGLFGRYAIAKLVEQHCVKEELPKDSTQAPCWILNGKYRLHLNIFCTTATPHLGISGHTWLRIPRTAEIGVAHALGQSGKDLFRLNDLLHTMATSPTFLEPLGAFRKRIAYANCYGTDFAVPVGTAAFLSENSTYPHQFVDDYIVDDNGMVIAALHTPAQKDSDVGGQIEVHSDELHEMSASLDKLGWKKVFVDIRKEMPSVELPKSIGDSLRMRRLNPDARIGDSGSNHSSNSANSGAETEDNNENVQNLNLQALKKQKIVSSKDLASAVAIPEDNRVALPLGHNMIVAFSRSRLSTFMNKGGRPVVDALAKELVEDIFAWDGTDAPPLTTSTRPTQTSKITDAATASTKDLSSSTIQPKATLQQ